MSKFTKQTIAKEMNRISTKKLFGRELIHCTESEILIAKMSSIQYILGHTSFGKSIRGMAKDLRISPTTYVRLLDGKIPNLVTYIKFLDWLDIDD